MEFHATSASLSQLFIREKCYHNQNKKTSKKRIKNEERNKNKVTIETYLKKDEQNSGQRVIHIIAKKRIGEVGRIQTNQENKKLELKTSYKRQETP